MAYTCAYCHKPLPAPKTKGELVCNKETPAGETKTVRVRCPACGKDNMVKVPK